MGWETLISAGIGLAGNVLSGDMAADASAAGANKAAETQRYMYDTTRKDLEPYRLTGQGALAQLAQLYGIPGPGSYSKPMSYEEYLASDQFTPGGKSSTNSAINKLEGLGAVAGLAFPLLGKHGRDKEKDSRENFSKRSYQNYLNDFTPSLIDMGSDGSYTTQPDYSAFYNSPDYKFAYDEGLKSVEQSLARRGLSDSGAAMKSLTRFGQGLASQQLGNYKNQLAALAGIGQTTSTNLGQFGANAASNMGNAYQSAADSRASSYLNMGSAISGAANQYGQYQLLKAGGYV